MSNSRLHELSALLRLAGPLVATAAIGLVERLAFVGGNNRCSEERQQDCNATCQQSPAAVPKAGYRQLIFHMEIPKKRHAPPRPDGSLRGTLSRSLDSNNRGMYLKSGIYLQAANRTTLVRFAQNFTRTVMPA